MRDSLRIGCVAVLHCCTALARIDPQPMPVPVLQLRQHQGLHSLCLCRRYSADRPGNAHGPRGSVSSQLCNRSRHFSGFATQAILRPAGCRSKVSCPDVTSRATHYERVQWFTTRNCCCETPLATTLLAMTGRGRIVACGRETLVTRAPSVSGVDHLVRRSRQAEHRGPAKSVPRSGCAPASEALRWGPIALLSALLSARFPNPLIEVRWVRWSRFRLAKDRPNPRGRPSTRTTETETETTPPSPNTALNQQIVTLPGGLRDFLREVCPASIRWMRQSGEVPLDRRSDAPSTVDAHQEVFVLVACGDPVP